MKNYEKPVLEEKAIELEDIIAASGVTVNGTGSSGKTVGIGDLFTK